MSPPEPQTKTGEIIIMPLFFLMRLIAISLGTLGLVACGGQSVSMPAKPPETAMFPGTPHKSRPPAQKPRPLKRHGGGQAEKTQNIKKPGDLSYEVWYKSFRTRALAKGVPVSVFDLAFDGVRPDPKILARLNQQPEFVSPIWDYMDKRLSEKRINKGRALLREHAVLFRDIQARYGVPAEIIAAIWGLETHYGSVMGHHDTVAALATLAMKQRKRAFAEAELYALFDILISGEAKRSWLSGSWAGAMGHVQFMPTSYRGYAIDYNGDGRKNIWSDTEDALASAASYLKNHAWQTGMPCLREVRLAERFDFDMVDRKKRPLTVWVQAGVKPVHAWPAALLSQKASLYLPAGAQGPAFLTFSNFSVIKRYNNADAYALSVCRLAQRLEGKAPITQPWPRHERILRRREIKQLQAVLGRLGFDAGPVDGVVGRKTRKAARAYQKTRRLIPDGFINSTLYEQVMGEHQGSRP